MNNSSSVDSKAGNIKHLFFLFFPLVGVALLSTLFPFLEKILLGRFSLEAMEAVIAASTVCNVVKIPCVTAAFIAQVHIGRFAGANTPEHMGPCIWQMIWFSFLSMIVTVPITLIYGHYYFAGTTIHDLALPYLYIMTAGNFLFPLGSALSCFYLGNRRGKELLKITFIIQSAGLCLACALIFGIPSIIPPLGLIGAAIAFIATQLLFCLVLFRNFSQSSTIYAPSSWKLRPSLLWEYLRTGLTRAFSTTSALLAWSVLSFFVIHEGNDFLLVLTLGGVLWEISSVLTEGLLQLLTTEVSQIIGSQQRSLIEKPFRTGLLFSCGISACLAIPLILFPQQLFHICFPTLSLPTTSLNTLALGLWACFTLDALNVVGLGYILAFKDTLQLLLRGILCWLFETGCAYLILKNFSIEAPQLWLVISTGLIFVATINLLRAFFLKKQFAASTQSSIENEVFNSPE